MSAHDEERIQHLLRQALPPVDAEPEPERDLWPAVLRRLDAKPSRSRAHAGFGSTGLLPPALPSSPLLSRPRFHCCFITCDRNSSGFAVHNRPHSKLRTTNQKFQRRTNEHTSVSSRLSCRSLCAHSLVLPIILTGFITVRLVLALPIPIERFIIFPMAVVPLLFGLWNMLYLGLHPRTHHAHRPPRRHPALYRRAHRGLWLPVVSACYRSARTASPGSRPSRFPTHISP